MDNTGDNGNKKDPAETTLTDPAGGDQPVSKIHGDIRVDIKEPDVPEPGEPSEDPAPLQSDPDQVSELEDPVEHPLAETANAPDEPDAGLSVSDQTEDAQGNEEYPMSESDDPSDDPGEELSSGEVRTALVAVRGQNRTAHFNAGEHTLKPGDEVVIQTEQGKAIGEVLEPPVVLACRGCKQLTILRKATPEEISRDEENRSLEKKAFEYCMKTIEEWEIPMRLVQVEFHLDRSKAVFYFTAEKRVDFRELVRTLAREFSTRIEMRQIGIRDEARLLGGVGPCGMAFCCSTFLKEFAPISVKMAKEQNVILNPNKISGGCGRLLCCLNYEYDQYREASRGVPKIGKKVNIPEGTGKVRSVDIFARTVTIDMTDDKPLVIDIDELREKMK